LDCGTVTAWVRETLEPSLDDVLRLREAKPDLKVPFDRAWEGGKRIRAARGGN
jgi:hypothetical protein